MSPHMRGAGNVLWSQNGHKSPLARPAGSRFQEGWAAKDEDDVPSDLERMDTLFEELGQDLAAQKAQRSVADAATREQLRLAALSMAMRWVDESPTGGDLKHVLEVAEVFYGFVTKP